MPGSSNHRGRAAPADLETGLAQVGEDATGQGINVASGMPIDRHGNDALDLD
jgi:hypothetical protein